VSATSWNYSGDPAASVLDELRFIVQDTLPDRPLLTDEECNYLLANWMDRYSSVIYVAAVAAAQISRKFAGVVSVSSDGVTVDVEKISDRYAAMALQLRSEYAASMVGGEVDLSSIMFDAELDSQIKPLTFGIGMHDNPAAGEQDFSGKVVPPRFEFPE
jgi:hypothetical protein